MKAGEFRRLIDYSLQNHTYLYWLFEFHLRGKMRGPDGGLKLPCLGNVERGNPISWIGRLHLFAESCVLSSASAAVHSVIELMDCTSTFVVMWTMLIILLGFQFAAGSPVAELKVDGAKKSGIQTLQKFKSFFTKRSALADSDCDPVRLSIYIYFLSK